MNCLSSHQKHAKDDMVGLYVRDTGNQLNVQSQPRALHLLEGWVGNETTVRQRTSLRLSKK